MPNDTALNSRFIVIPLQETERRDLKRLADPEIQKLADQLQRQLLQYRFEKLNSLTLPRVEGDDRLRGRNRDLYEALARANGDPGQCGDKAFEFLEEQNREPLSLCQTAVLRTLFSLVHTTEYYHYDPYPWVSIGNLGGLVNQVLESRSERFRVSPRQVGAILTSLGITNRKPCSWGWKVWLEREEERRVHDLVFRYGLDDTYGKPNIPACFREWARLMEGKSEHLLEDAMIAATARVHGLKVATRNENDFKLFRVDLVNPFRHRS